MDGFTLSGFNELVEEAMKQIKTLFIAGEKWINGYVMRGPNEQSCKNNEI